MNSWSSGHLIRKTSESRVIFIFAVLIFVIYRMNDAIIYNSAVRNKFQWNVSQTEMTSFHAGAFKTVACKLLTILVRR